MYTILLMPLLAMIIAQICKFIFKSYKLKWKNLFAYSGMPSGHSAIVISLVTIVGLELGWKSPLFAISFFIALLTIRDALGIRRYLGEHGKVLNVLVKDLKKDQVLDKKYPHLLEKIGHTPTQVLVGSIIGFLVSALGYLLFK